VAASPANANRFNGFPHIVRTAKAFPPAPAGSACAFKFFKIDTLDTTSQICEVQSLPEVRLILFRADNGTVPFLDWFGAIPRKAQDKCRVRLERLQQLGHELRRPEADFLRDGIYELRVGLQGINYRMLYFFRGREAVVVSHGIIKERVVPPKEIDLALKRKGQFEVAPNQHTHEELL
jgi:phage-related protein